MANRIILTGGMGFVGGNIVTQAGPGWEIHAITRQIAPASKGNLHWHSVDPLDRDSLGRLFAEVRPDAVIHAAALSDIDACEADPETAERINVGITDGLVALCRAFGSKMVYFSSDSIFDGLDGGYEECAPPNPINVYAKTKVAAERVVMMGAPIWVIVRPSLVMGFPVGETGNAFLFRLVQSLRKGQAVALPKAELRTPVDVVTLSRAVIELTEGRYSGHFHLSCHDALSRYEIGVRICRRLGYPTHLVVDSKPSVATGRARRPANVSLSNAKSRGILKVPMRDFDASLELAIENNGTKEL